MAAVLLRAASLAFVMVLGILLKKTGIVGNPARVLRKVEKSLRKESKVVQTKKQYGDFSLTALSFASISIFSG